MCDLFQGSRQCITQLGYHDNETERTRNVCLEEHSVKQPEGNTPMVKQHMRKLRRALSWVEQNTVAFEVRGCTKGS